jgi:hypothetical protein
MFCQEAVTIVLNPTESNQWRQPGRSGFHVFAEFDVPIGEIHKMAPTVVAVQGEIDLHKRAPFRALGFADQIHAGLKGCAVGLAGIAGDA